MLTHADTLMLTHADIHMLKTRLSFYTTEKEREKRDRR